MFMKCSYMKDLSHLLPRGTAFDFRLVGFCIFLVWQGTLKGFNRSEPKYMIQMKDAIEFDDILRRTSGL